MNTLEAEQVPGTAGRPSNPPNCLISTTQRKSRCASGVAKVAESVTRSCHFLPFSPAGLGFARVMRFSHGSGWMPVRTLCAVAPDPMSTLTTSVPSTEVLEDALLTLDQISTRITVLALNAPRNPEQSARVRALMSDLLADIQDCEEQLGTYDPLDAS